MQVLSSSNINEATSKVFSSGATIKGSYEIDTVLSGHHHKLSSENFSLALGCSTRAGFLL